MYIVIAIALVVTSFIVGRLTSPARFYKDDKAWLLERLEELGIEAKVIKEVTAEQATKPKETVNNVKQVDNVIENHKKAIKQEFQKAVYNNIAKGTFLFRHHSASYNLLPEDAFKAYICQLMTEYAKTNSNVSLSGKTGFSSGYGQRYLDITVKIG